MIDAFLKILKQLEVRVVEIDVGILLGLELVLDSKVLTLSAWSIGVKLLGYAHTLYKGRR